MTASIGGDPNRRVHRRLVSLIVVADLRNIVRALDVRTGDVRWQVTSPVPLHEYGGLSVTTDAVLIVGTDGAIAVLDLVSGAVRWRRDLAARAFFSHTDDAMFVGIGDDRVRAVSVRDGSTLWETTVSAMADRYGSTTTRRLLLSTDSEALVLRLEDGAEVGRYQARNLQPPTVGRDSVSCLIRAADGDPARQQVVCLDMGGSG